jgi:hypothetical protein
MRSGRGRCRERWLDEIDLLGKVHGCATSSGSPASSRPPAGRELPEDQLQLALQDTKQEAEGGQATVRNRSILPRAGCAPCSAADQVHPAGAPTQRREGGRCEQHRMPLLCGNATPCRRERVAAPGRHAGPVPSAGPASRSVPAGLAPTRSQRRRRRLPRLPLPLPRRHNHPHRQGHPNHHDDLLLGPRHD